MKRVWTFRIVILINIALVVFALNPWFEDWSAQAMTALAIESAILVLVGVPLMLFQMLVRKKSLKQSIRDAVDAVMDFLTGAV